MRGPNKIPAQYIKLISGIAERPRKIPREPFANFRGYFLRGTADPYRDPYYDQTEPWNYRSSLRPRGCARGCEIGTRLLARIAESRAGRAFYLGGG